MKKLVFIFFLSILLLTIATPVLASNFLGLPDGHIIPPDCRGTSGQTQTVQECNLEDAFQFVVNISTVIVALTGSAALLMFAYGGVMFILAAGQAERISKAKEILKAAVIGLIIILLSWVMVNMIISALTEGRVGGQGLLFGNRPFNVEPSAQNEVAAPASEN